MRIGGFIAFSVTLLATRAAAAQQVEKPAAGQPAAADPTAPDPEAKPVEHVRLDLGVSIIGWDDGYGGVSYWPSAQTGVELHLAGPAWLVGRGRVRYREYSSISGVGGLGGQAGVGVGVLESTSSELGGGGDLGVRLEEPVFEWLEIGGHVMLGATYSSYSAPPQFESEAFSFGAHGGVGAHLRPTRFFGMRLGLDVLRAGHAWQLTAHDGGRSSASYAEVVAWPTFEMTFTF